jgi:hypothetical protein
VVCLRLDLVQRFATAFDLGDDVFYNSREYLANGGFGLSPQFNSLLRTKAGRGRLRVWSCGASRK